MDVPITELRAHLSEWLDRARGGGQQESPALAA